MKEKDKYDEKKMFRVPDTYFEDLTSGLMQELEEKQEKRKPGLLALARPHLTLAASMLVLVIISYATLRFILPEFRQYNEGAGIDELTEYLACELDDAGLLESIEPVESTIDPGETSVDISDEDIIEYLVFQDINYESLIENL